MALDVRLGRRNTTDFVIEVSIIVLRCDHIIISRMPYMKNMSVYMTVIEAVCQITLDRPMPIKEGVQQIPMFRSYVDRARSQSTTNGLRNPFD